VIKLYKSLLLFVAISIISCAASEPKYPIGGKWIANVSQTQFNVDKNICMTATGYSPTQGVVFGPLPFVAAIGIIAAVAEDPARHKFCECMECRGYIYQKPEPTWSERNTHPAE
jgi:hypothetical protein